MKNCLLAFFLLTISSISFAQLPNPGFDVWETDTAIFGYPPFVPNDTFAYRKPQGWYSVNAITGNKHIGGKFFVEETNALALFGSSSVKLTTDSIIVTNPALKLIVPGFVVNGSFSVSLIDLLQNNTSLSPAEIPGAGTPVNARKQKLKAYVQYTPIQGDSLLIWAVLKKNNQVIAEAKINYNQAAANTLLLEKDFVYTSCEMPDTAVVMIASSTPDFSTALGGETGIEAGSVLFIDSVILTDLPVNFQFPPFANRDQTFTTKDAPKTIDVLANDYDCSNTPINVTSVGAPLSGTAVKNTNNTITYTPNAGFIGSDSFSYTISNANGTATANVFINVFNFSTGISNVNTSTFKFFPNPAHEKIMVEFAPKTLNQEVIRIADLSGKILITKSIVNQVEEVDLQNLSNGIYILKIGNSTQRLIKL